MDQEDLPPHARFAIGEVGSYAPKDARPTTAEGSGASSAGDVLGRLRDLQRQVAHLVDQAEQRDVRDGVVVPGAGTRIVIVPTAPRRPELPPRAPGPRRLPAAPERHPRSGAERRGPASERRTRRDRRRHGRRDPRPVALRVERRAGEERRSGRGDRRLGHDRRSVRRARPRRDRRGGTLLFSATFELLVFAAGLIALVRGR